MRTTILLFIIFFTAIVGYSQTWVKKQLSDKVSIDFPSPAEIKILGERTFYTVSDSNFVINVVVSDMSAAPGFNIQPNEFNGFYKSVIMGRLGGVSDPRVLDEKDIEIYGHKGIEIKYTKDFNGLNDVPVVSQIVLIEKAFFIFDFCELSKNTQGKTLDKFFKSIQITKQ
jgi:hypothetical protein